MINEIIERIKTNLKLTEESVVVIGAELLKLLSYWLLIKDDTLVIWKVFEDWLKGFKKNLWK